MARARLQEQEIPDCCYTDEDEVSQEIGLNLDGVSIQKLKVSGFNPNPFIFRLLLIFT